MIIKKKDAIELLQQYKDLFTTRDLFGKSCTVMFDMHKSNGFIVTDIVKRSLKEIDHKPDKVEFEGKNRSPMVFEVVNNQAPLYFLFDDTTVVGLGNGVRFIVNLDKPLNDREVIEVDIRVA